MGYILRVNFYPHILELCARWFSLDVVLANVLNYNQESIFSVGVNLYLDSVNGFP